MQGHVIDDLVQFKLVIFSLNLVSETTSRVLFYKQNKADINNPFLVIVKFDRIFLIQCLTRF